MPLSIVRRFATFFAASAALLLVLAAALALVVLLPGEALAWGPGVHLAIGNQLLQNAGIFGPSLAALLTAHPQPFLYGTLSADIFVGKGCQAKPGHSHNWQVGLELLDNADSEGLRAYALGYATHLAADVLAHNHYVPTMLTLTPGGGKLSHVLLEMQADRRVYWSSRQAKGLFQALRYEAQDELLLRTTRRQRWPFLLKKQLLKSTVRFTGNKNLRKPLSSLRKMLPIVPPMGAVPEENGLPSDVDAAVRVWNNQEYLLRMLDLSLILAREAVLQPQVCLAREFDPIGSTNIAAVRDLRRLGPSIGGIPPEDYFPLPPQLQRFALDMDILKEARALGEGEQLRTRD